MTENHAHKGCYVQNMHTSLSKTCNSALSETIASIYQSQLPLHITFGFYQLLHCLKKVLQNASLMALKMQYIRISSPT